MREALEHYEPRKVVRSFCSCPLHSEKTASFKIFDDTNSFYCFGCGAGGDVIKFVSLLFKLNYSESMRKIDTDFCMGLFKKPSLSQYRRNNQITKQHETQRADREQKAEKSNAEYIKLCEYHRWLIQQKTTIAIQHDIDFIGRLLDKFLNPDKLFEFDVSALINSLKIKHNGTGEVKDYAAGF
jgi:DNA primase (bacterial type)